MDRFRVAIVIPAFNESATIAEVVTAALIYGQPIVVDDCSVDDTASAAEAAGAIVVKHEVNKGYDDALNSGFREASRLEYDFIITLDADGQHDPALLQEFILRLNSGASLVLGVRNSKARLSEYIFSLYTKLRFGVLDPLCGLKGYRRSVYESVGFFDSYRSIGTELMLRAISSGVGFEQIHFKVRERSDQPRFGRLLSANWKILRALLIWVFLQ